MGNTILPDFHEIFGDLRDPRNSITICFNMRAAPSYFINFLYAFKLPPHRCACLLPSPCNLNLCTKLPQLQFEGACTQQSISCPFCCWGAPATPGLLPAGSFSCHSGSKKPRQESKGEKKKKKVYAHTTCRAANCKRQQLAARMRFLVPCSGWVSAMAPGAEGAASRGTPWVKSGDQTGGRRGAAATQRTKA